MYIAVDPSYPFKSLNKKLRRVDATKMFGSSIADSRFLQDFAEDAKRPWISTLNSTFDCVLHVETELPKGDKTRSKYDALSLIIIELNYSGHPKMPNYVEVASLGHSGARRKVVSKKAHYSDRIWAATNPNFLLSGQLSGFDSIDYRTKIDEQHIIKPEALHSTFDKPASITVNMSNWTWNSHIYMVFTSYKYLRNGERCQEHKEFDCSAPSFLSSSTDHMCMSSTLACDGLPNCGQDYLPNQDENCFKIHWSSVLLSLVSYILLAITLLLCLSCFARVLIQWSVRSSLAELRGIGSPTGSFRSSSRFFSFLGNTFTSRWERPPPTYDEAMKHVNPDLARPNDPPPYNDTFSDSERAAGSSGRRVQPSGATSIVETPPPDYGCQDGHHYLERGGGTSALRSTNVRTSSSGASNILISSSSPSLLESSVSHHQPAVVILPPTPLAHLPPSQGHTHPQGCEEPLLTQSGANARSSFLLRSSSSDLHSNLPKLHSQTNDVTENTVHADICQTSSY